MKRTLLLICMALISSLTTISELEARGGGRGGGGGRAGGGGGRSVQRSPSMSRAQARPASRPQVSNRPNNLARPQNLSGNRQNFNQNANRTAANRTASRNDVQQFLNNHPNAGSLNGNRANLNQSNLAQNVRNDIAQNRPNLNNAFNNNFWDNHGYRPPYYNNRANFWAVATAATVGGWLGWSASPVYYGGYGYTDTYTNTYPTTTSTPVNYTQQTEAIDKANTSADASSDEWLPLGVFAVTNPTESSATPSMYLQFALNKAGMLSGTYYNTTTDQVHELEGVVDPKTQRAAWKIADNENSPILVTGLYNLTQDEAPADVNFSNGKVQQVVLVRVNQQS